MSLLKSDANLKYNMGEEKVQSQRKSERQGLCGAVVGINEDEKPRRFTRGTLCAAKWE